MQNFARVNFPLEGEKTTALCAKGHVKLSTVQNWGLVQEALRYYISRPLKKILVNIFFGKHQSYTA
jgi:hypothetical protein